MSDTGFWNVSYLKRTHNLRGLGVDGSIILKWILKKKGMRL
jgi:hypothetical protein